MSGRDTSALAQRMKFYERRHTDDVFLPYIPVLARVDGRAFHTFTNGLIRPYDPGMSALMVETTKYLVGETNARIGYTQSDEISLAWLTEDFGSEIFFAGRVVKLTSVIGGLASAFFNFMLATFLPEKASRLRLWQPGRDGLQLPVFDSRAWQVPTEFEATNYFIWREQDASRNSIQMAARAHYTHDECHQKNSEDLHDMLHAKGVNWNDYPFGFKRGTYVRRRTVEHALDLLELTKLPEKHEARRNPDMKVVRAEIVAEEIPPLVRLDNREDVVFRGAKPMPRNEP